MENKQHELFIRHLQHALSYTRPPRQLKKSFTSTSKDQASQKCTSRIFLEVGFQSWLAHFLAVNRTSRLEHFDGKSSDTKSLADFEGSSILVKRTIADRVHSEKLDPVLERRVKDWEAYCKKDRSEKDISTMLVATGQAEGGNPTATSNISHRHPSSTSQIETPQHTTEDAPNILTGTSSQDQSLLHGNILHQQTLGASISGVMDLFPPYICSAIVKDHGSSLAMIQMSFPHFPSDDCYMTLSIQPNKVEHLAMTLFGIHLESDGDQRYIVLDNGARTMPSHQMLLDGANEAVLVTIFGTAVSGAIQSSWKRTLELASAKRRTGCVLLEVSSKSNEPASLGLWLWLEKALELKQILYA